jgi:type IV secretory pathway VirB4 component
MIFRKKILTPEEEEVKRTKDFFDCILPGTVKFQNDHYIFGDSYRCVWAVREYPPSTDEQAILSRLADRTDITLHIYDRLVDSAEQRKIIQNAARRNRMMSTGNDITETVQAQGNLQDVTELIANMRKNREPLLHCAVFIELKAASLGALKELQSETAMELTRSKITVDRLTLRQKEGFLSVLPTGCDRFGTQYERVLPASSVADLYPFNYSGKTDPHGLYIGRDKYGTNILVDFDRRAQDKTTSNILILGNSGQGKSYLMKLILTNLRESGKSVTVLDAEDEYAELTEALGGCCIDLMSGEYIINPLEPKEWSGENSDGGEDSEPEAFRRATRLSRHIAYLKDFFRA